MYYWAHSEIPVSIPETPGKLSSISWPPTSPSSSEMYTPNSHVENSTSASKSPVEIQTKEERSKTEPKLSAKDVVDILAYEEEIKRLKQEVEKYKTLCEIQNLTAKTVQDFSSPIEEEKIFYCKNCDKSLSRKPGSDNNNSDIVNLNDKSREVLCEEKISNSIDLKNEDLEQRDIKSSKLNGPTLKTDSTTISSAVDVVDGSIVPAKSSANTLQTDFYNKEDLESADALVKSTPIPPPPPPPPLPQMPELSFVENSLPKSPESSNLSNKFVPPCPPPLPGMLNLTHNSSVPIQENRQSQQFPPPPPPPMMPGVMAVCPPATPNFKSANLSPQSSLNAIPPPPPPMNCPAPLPPPPVGGWEVQKSGKFDYSNLLMHVDVICDLCAFSNTSSQMIY